MSVSEPAAELAKTQRVVRGSRPAGDRAVVSSRPLGGLPAWIAAEEVARAASGWGADPELAFSRLDSARRLNPFSSEPDLVAGAIAIRLGETGRAEVLFRRALTPAAARLVRAPGARRPRDRPAAWGSRSGSWRRRAGSIRSSPTLRIVTATSRTATR